MSPTAAPAPRDADDPRAATGTARWRRPTPQAQGPDRSFGGYYRTADRVIDGDGPMPNVESGAPLRGGEDAMVAAVRTGYRIAEAQIARGLRWARPAGAAAAGATPAGDAAARDGAAARPASDAAAWLDAFESALKRSAALGLQGLEAAARDPSHPLRRLVDAESQWLATLWQGWFAAAGRALRPQAAASDPPTPGPQAAAPPATATSSAAASVPALRQLAAPDRRRVVLSIDAALPTRPVDAGTALPLVFHPDPATRVGDRPPAPLHGHWTADAQGPGTVAVDVGPDAPAGRWTAGLYDAEGLQLGWIRLAL